MSTDPSFIEYVVDQAGLGARLRPRKMFGEYGFHLDGTFIMMACNESLFLKETPAIAARGLDFPMAPPYPGAKPYPVVDALLDDPAEFRALLLDTLKLLDAPAPKKPKGAKKRSA